MDATVADAVVVDVAAAAVVWSEGPLGLFNVCSLVVVVVVVESVMFFTTSGIAASVKPGIGAAAAAAVPKARLEVVDICVVEGEGVGVKDDMAAFLFASMTMDRNAVEVGAGVLKAK